MSTLPKLLIIGHATHGKDTCAEFLEAYGFRCMASSTFATRQVMLPYFAHIGVVYPNEEACYRDRVHHRSTWFQQIEAYNSPYWDRMTREMFDQGYDVYIGMRSRKEFEKSRPLFDKVFWVDASKRLPMEPTTSNELTPQDADAIIDNNGTLDQLKRNVFEAIKDLPIKA